MCFSFGFRFIPDWTWNNIWKEVIVWLRFRNKFINFNSHLDLCWIVEKTKRKGQFDLWWSDHENNSILAVLCAISWIYSRLNLTLRRFKTSSQVTIHYQQIIVGNNPSIGHRFHPFFRKNCTFSYHHSTIYLVNLSPVFTVNCVCSVI